MSEEREAIRQWRNDFFDRTSREPTPTEAWYAALKWQAARHTTHLSNLLARIHRDGGHYEAEHGTEKAVAEADKRIAELNGAQSELEECAKKLLDFVDGLLLPVQDYAGVQETLERLRALLARAQAKE